MLDQGGCGYNEFQFIVHVPSPSHPERSGKNLALHFYSRPVKLFSFTYFKYVFIITAGNRKSFCVVFYADYRSSGYIFDKQTPFPR